MTCKTHLNDRGEQAAVGAIVVSEEFLLPAELLDGVPESFQVGGIVHVRRGLAHLGDSLGEDGTTEPVFAAAQINQQQNRISDSIVIARRVFTP